MSLHIGNLSFRTRRDDLERIFRRFGRCTVQIKDKYGFAVYDHPVSAEKALRTLRGTRICGQAITLSWSKQQPHSSRSGRSYEPPRGRYYSVNEKYDKKLGPGYPQDHKMDSERTDEVRNESIYLGENEETSVNDRKNHPEDNRWGEQVVDPANEKYPENGMEFDRYEPDHGKGKTELEESQHVSQFARSPTIRMSRERKRNSCNRISETNSPRRLNPRDKKRNRREYGSRGINYVEGAKVPSSSSVYSDYTLSRSQSPSKSKSVPSKKIVQSSPLRSSPSCHSGTKTFRSRSRPRSMSPNSSLSPVEELTRDLSRSPGGRQKGLKDYVGIAVTLALSNNLLEDETLTFKCERITSAVDNEFETKPDILEQEDAEKDLSENDNGHFHSVSRGSHEFLESYVPQSNSDGLIIDNSTRESQNEDLVEEHTLAQESDISTMSDAHNPAKMSSKEVCMVLKHYGLPYPEEKEKDLPVESIFGSASLWPWGMIYYRRLKKGHISADNYSRRIAQNQEFGIVDKYIRGSSGWGELN
ncbi:hypothetical protein OROGR_018646 [Orobanche gracilis]